MKRRRLGRCLLGKLVERVLKLVLANGPCIAYKLLKVRKLNEINIAQLQLINWLNEFSF